MKQESRIYVLRLLEKWFAANETDHLRKVLRRMKFAKMYRRHFKEL